MEKTHFSKLEDVKVNLDHISLMWNSLKEWKTKVIVWKMRPFGQLDA